MKKIESGFSLIELLVVVAIIGILAAVGTVGYGNYIKSSKQKSLEANVANLASAIVTRDGAVAAGVETKLTDFPALIADIKANSQFKNPYNPADTTVFSAGSALTGTCTDSNRGQIVFTLASHALSTTYCLDTGSTVVSGTSATLQAY